MKAIGNNLRSLTELLTPRELLSALAPHDPIQQEELGYCMHCGGMPSERRQGHVKRYLSDHKPGCPWVKARRVLGDTLPAARESVEFIPDRPAKPSAAGSWQIGRSA